MDRRKTVQLAHSWPPSSCYVARVDEASPRPALASLELSALFLSAPLSETCPNRSDARFPACSRSRCPRSLHCYALCAPRPQGASCPASVLRAAEEAIARSTAAPSTSAERRIGRAPRYRA